MQTKSQLRFSHPGQTKTVAGMGKLRPPTYLSIHNFTQTAAKVKVKITQLCPTLQPMQLQSMEFSKPEYWSGQPFPSPGDLPNPGMEPRSTTLQVDSLPAEPQGKPKNTGVGSLSLLQWIFPTQELNQGLLHCRWILYQLSYEGCPRLLARQRQKAQKMIPCVTGVQNWWKVEGIPEH